MAKSKLPLILALVNAELARIDAERAEIRESIRRLTMLDSSTHTKFSAAGRANVRKLHFARSRGPKILPLLNKPKTLAELVKATKFTSAQLSSSLHNMMRAGYIRRVPPPPGALINKTGPKTMAYIAVESSNGQS